MTALELSGIILTLEFALVAWAILFFLLRRQRKLQKAEEAHAGNVMEEIETNEDSRRDALKNLFESTYKLEGDELTAKVDEYVNREKAFYNAMLSLYLERDGTKLTRIPAELASVVAPWMHLKPAGMIEASEVGQLETEKAALETELESTKNTLEELMEEYMAAFDKSGPKKAPVDPLPADVSSDSLLESDIDPLDISSADEGFEAGSETTDPPPATDFDDEIEAAFQNEDADSQPSPGDANAYDQEKQPAAEPPDESDVDEYDIAPDDIEGLADLFDSASDKS